MPDPFAEYYEPGAKIAGNMKVTIPLGPQTSQEIETVKRTALRRGYTFVGESTAADGSTVLEFSPGAAGGARKGRKGRKSRKSRRARKVRKTRKH